MAKLFSIGELQDIQLAEPFSYTKGCRVMKIQSSGQKDVKIDPFRFGTLLFDLEEDPGQLNPVKDAEVEKTMIRYMERLMRENDAPPEQYERLGLTPVQA
jgi:hypothetical protein